MNVVVMVERMKGKNKQANVVDEGENENEDERRGED